MEKSETPNEIKEGIIGSSIIAYNELVVILKPIMHDKIKHVNGKLLKDCMKHFKIILEAHQYIKEHII